MQTITEFLPQIEGVLTSKSSTDNSTDLSRIAQALERIATSLEKLTGSNIKTNEDNQVSSGVKTSNSVAEPGPSKIVTLTEKAKPTNPEKGSIEKNRFTSPAPLIKQGPLENYLAARGFRIISQNKVAKDQERENKLNQLASYMGQHFEEIVIFYQHLKQKAHAPYDGFTYSVKELAPNKQASIKNLCKKLKEVSLLEKLEFNGTSGEIIELKVAKKSQNYLTGEWFERYIEQKVKHILKKHCPANFPRRYQPNIKICSKDGLAIELDFLFALKQQIFCIETKTNTHLQELRNYLKRIEPLKLENRILIVVTEKSNQECQQLSQALNGTKVVGLDNFEEALIALITAVCEPSQSKIALG